MDWTYATHQGCAKGAACKLSICQVLQMCLRYTISSLFRAHHFIRGSCNGWNQGWISGILAYTTICTRSSWVPQPGWILSEIHQIVWSHCSTVHTITTKTRFPVVWRINYSIWIPETSPDHNSCTTISGFHTTVCCGLWRFRLRFWCCPTSRLRPSCLLQQIVCSTPLEGGCLWAWINRTCASSSALETIFVGEKIHC